MLQSRTHMFRTSTYEILSLADEFKFPKYDTDCGIFVGLKNCEV